MLNANDIDKAARLVGIFILNAAAFLLFAFFSQFPIEKHWFIAIIVVVVSSIVIYGALNNSADRAYAKGLQDAEKRYAPRLRMHPLVKKHAAYLKDAVLLDVSDWEVINKAETLQIIHRATGALYTPRQLNSEYLLSAVAITIEQGFGIGSHPVNRIVQEFCEAYTSPGTDRWHFVFDLAPEQLADRAIRSSYDPQSPPLHPAFAKHAAQLLDATLFDGPVWTVGYDMWGGLRLIEARKHDPTPLHADFLLSAVAIAMERGFGIGSHPVNRIVQEFCEAYTSPGTDRWHFVFDLAPEQLADRAIRERLGGLYNRPPGSGR